MATTKNITYNVIGKLKLEVAVPVTAPSLEEAIAKARELKETDFVTIDGDYMDGDIKIIGLYEA